MALTTPDVATQPPGGTDPGSTDGQTGPGATPTLASATREDLERYLEQAHLPSLIPTLAYLTGELGLLREDFRPQTVSLYAAVSAQGGMTPDQQQRARAMVLDVLLEFRDHGAVPAPSPSVADLRSMMEFMTGPVDEAYIPILLHELGLPEDAGAPRWTKQETAPDTDFNVVVIGAGMSGLAAAYRLSQAGIAFQVLERNPVVGGVWFNNTYPGARLDTSNFTYSYSFAQYDSWKSNYTRQEEVLRYLQQVAADLDLRDHIRFSTRVVDGAWDSDNHRWTLTVELPTGERSEVHANAVISAVGQLNEPNVPELPGIDRFTGQTWHTAQWRHDVDLTGKRVALIGTGASAFQVVPYAAEQASELAVFQRTPAWVIPTPGYTGTIADGLQWLFRHVPHYHRWFRYQQFWLNVDGIRHLAVVDPDWPGPASVSAANQATRERLTDYLTSSFEDRPDLLAALTPDYPPYAKRTLRDDGTWAAAMRRSDVELVTSPIAEVDEHGIRTADGASHPCDVIIYGTGFKASEFLRSVSWRGRDGTALADQWDGDARAFWGVTIPNFPNLFCLYGPNTNLNVNGSVVLFSEAGVEYTLECIRTLLASGHAEMEVREQPYEDYNAWVDAMSQTLAVGVSTVNTWYKNARGRVSQNWPGTTLQYWQGTRGPGSDDYTYR